MVGNKELTHCSVCLENLQQIKEKSKLICGHIFHKECIDTWFKNTKSYTTCPICRKVEPNINYLKLIDVKNLNKKKCDDSNFSMDLFKSSCKYYKWKFWKKMQDSKLVLKEDFFEIKTKGLIDEYNNEIIFNINKTTDILSFYTNKDFMCLFVNQCERYRMLVFKHNMELFEAVFNHIKNVISKMKK
uniref:RING-type domain-containing protein n=1 Tax=viral metagenome TaxID=1070528 RepID=A0A6C0ACQ2_9ZZZZ